MVTFSQSTGALVAGPLNWACYAGRDAGKNNPAMQDVHDVGPLPRGKYGIQQRVECVRFDADARCPDCDGKGYHKHGPYVLRLIPDPANEMFGRAGFLCHGDLIDCPGTASHGCIVAPKVARQAINATGERELEVTE